MVTQIFWDVEKFFDSLDIPILVEGAVKRGFPKLVLALLKYAKDKGNNNLNELFSTASPTRKRKKYYVCIEEEVSESDQVGHIELGNLLTTIGKAMIGQTPNEPVGQTNHPVNKFSHLEHGNNPPVNQVGHTEHNA